MPQVVLVWEMGADLGHVTRLDSLAKHLIGRGHSVVCVFSSLNETQRTYLPPATPPYQVIQGPSWPDRRSKLSRSPANLAEVLLSIGYHQPQLVATKLGEWRAIFSQLQPDVIIYDYAPTALLATRDYSCKKISLDDPFSKPPETFPLPSFDQNAKVSTANLAISDSRLVDIVNQVLLQFQLSPIKQASDLFASDKSFLLSIPELDPFAHLRNAATYLGFIEAQSCDKKIPLNWNTESNAKKVFAYLKPSYPKLKELLYNIMRLNIQGRFFIPHADQAILDICKNSNMEISNTPYDLSENLPPCDLVICHGGHSTLLQAALCGVPALIIPLQQEQLSTTQKCVDSGLALWLGHGVTDSEKIQSILQALLYDQRFQQSVQQCAMRYRNRFTRSAMEVIVEYVETCV